jgi:hypothetical protein
VSRRLRFIGFLPVPDFEGENGPPQAHGTKRASGGIDRDALKINWIFIEKILHLVVGIHNVFENILFIYFHII